MGPQATLHRDCLCKLIQCLPVCESALFEHLLGEGALHIHDQLQHFVVGLAREQDLASEQLVDHTTHTPDVQGVVCITASANCQHEGHMVEAR